MTQAMLYGSYIDYKSNVKWTDGMETAPTTNRTRGNASRISRCLRCNREKKLRERERVSFLRFASQMESARKVSKS